MGSLPLFNTPTLSPTVSCRTNHLRIFLAFLKRVRILGAAQVLLTDKLAHVIAQAEAPSEGSRDRTHAAAWVVDPCTTSAVVDVASSSRVYDDGCCISQLGACNVLVCHFSSILLVFPALAANRAQQVERIRHARSALRRRAGASIFRPDRNVCVSCWCVHPPPFRLFPIN